MLVRRRAANLLSPEVASGMPYLGIMLPYAPLHYLLLDHDFSALVMTSANRTDEPLCTGNREAVERLSGIADYFLVHNRDIVLRCDDSIAVVAAGEARICRRARGFVPRPVPLSRKLPAVLALGPHLKATMCIVQDELAWLSPHIGDMETPSARDFFHASIDLMRTISHADSQIVACDMHPGYYSTAAARGGASFVVGAFSAPFKFCFFMFSSKTAKCPSAELFVNSLK